mmetsp:Transcript_11117/g.34314  ORF Transcript_11117/g.34314 Transcript_11117/m.34314 type:complete len:231 (-) Transcript_11117:1027-1719(-)
MTMTTLPRRKRRWIRKRKFRGLSHSVSHRPRPRLRPCLRLHHHTHHPRVHGSPYHRKRMLRGSSVVARTARLLKIQPQTAGSNAVVPPPRTCVTSNFREPLTAGKVSALRAGPAHLRLCMRHPSPRYPPHRRCRRHLVHRGHHPLTRPCLRLHPRRRRPTHTRPPKAARDRKKAAIDLPCLLHYIQARYLLPLSHTWHCHRMRHLARPRLALDRYLVPRWRCCLARSRSS